jgi:hypothetical protein
VELWVVVVVVVTGGGGCVTLRLEFFRSSWCWGVREVCRLLREAVEVTEAIETVSSSSWWELDCVEGLLLEKEGEWE